MLSTSIIASRFFQDIKIVFGTEHYSKYFHYHVDVTYRLSAFFSIFTFLKKSCIILSGAGFSPSPFFLPGCTCISLHLGKNNRIIPSVRENHAFIDMKYSFDGLKLC